MNRRNFLGKVALAGAVAPALTVVSGGKMYQYQEGDTSPQEIYDSRTPTPNDPVRPVEFATATHLEPVTTSSSKAFYEDRLTLFQMRGLMVPCPNCGENGTSWRNPVESPYFIECRHCSWRDAPQAYEVACPCVDCRPTFTVPDEVLPVRVENYVTYEAYLRAVAERRDALRHLEINPKRPPVDETLAKVQVDAEPGLYRIVEPGFVNLSIPVQRKQLNAYHVNMDRVIHHAVEQQFARVICAVRLFTQERNLQKPMGYEESRQPNGNLVLLGWSMVDCFEWQVERGEKPPVAYEKHPDGRVTLVQGVKA